MLLLLLLLLRSRLDEERKKVITFFRFILEANFNDTTLVSLSLVTKYFSVKKFKNSKFSISAFRTRTETSLQEQFTIAFWKAKIAQAFYLKIGVFEYSRQILMKENKNDTSLPHYAKGMN